MRDNMLDDCFTGRPTDHINSRLCVGSVVSFVTWRPLPVWACVSRCMWRVCCEALWGEKIQSALNIVSFVSWNHIWLGYYVLLLYTTPPTMSWEQQSKWSSVCVNAHAGWRLPLTFSCAAPLLHCVCLFPLIYSASLSLCLIMPCRQLPPWPCPFAQTLADIGATTWTHSLTQH